MNQRQILLGAIAVLIPVWWLTRPGEAPVEPQPSPNIWAAESEFAPRIETSNDKNPAWAVNIDTSRAKCRKMKEELLRQAANGTGMDLVYIGDCDKRQARQTPGN